jgi:competence protein ComEC
MNRYGHPHTELMDRLTNIGSEPIITYESGAITIKTNGIKMIVEKYLR